MSRNVLLILILLSSLPFLNARTIQGKVLATDDSTTVVGATCRLFIDGKQATSTSTDNSGHFSLNTNARTALTLEVSAFGYTPTEIIIESGSTNLNIGKVYLDSPVDLQEITVSTQQVIHSKGRTIIYPSGYDIKASSSAISLFQKLPLPGLDANPITRSITVDGGSPVILINGIPSDITDVQSLLPKDIEKVEYTRYAPARYTDKGNKGYINITLKARKDGGQVYLWGRSALTTAFVDANLRTSYHQGPSQFTLSYNPTWRNYQSVYDYKISSFIGDDFRTNLVQNDRDPFNYHGHNVRLKYDFKPSARTLFSATFNATPSYRNNRTLAHIIDSQLGEYDSRNQSSTNGFTPSLDLFLRHEFNPSNSIEAEIVGTIANSRYRRDNSYFFTEGDNESYIMNVHTIRRSLISEISYIHNFSDKTQLSAGFQNTISRSTNTYMQSDYKPLLTENNNYIYARLGQSIGKVHLSLSTGAELFWVHNDLNRRHFIRNLSSANLDWNINKSWNLQAVFRYVPSIPSLSSLTDYPQQTTPYLISNGNPDLKVSQMFLYNLALGYTYRKFRVDFITVYQDVDKHRVADVVYLGNHLFLSQSVNSRYNRQIGNNLSLRLTNVCGFGARAWLSYSLFRSAGYDWKHSLNTFNATISVWWNKGPFTVSWYHVFPGKVLDGQSVSKGENYSSFQLDYKPDNRWTFGANWMWPFNRKGSQYPAQNLSAVNPWTSERYIKDNSNMVTLSVTYTANFGTIFRIGRRSLNNTDNGTSLLQL